MSINWGIPAKFCSVDWSTTAKGIEDLVATAKYMKDTYGIIIDRFTMNSNTLSQLFTGNHLAVTSYLHQVVRLSGMPSLEAVNAVLVSNYRIAPIVVEDYMISYYNADGITIKKTESAFADGRVTDPLVIRLVNIFGLLQTSNADLIME